MKKILCALFLILLLSSCMQYYRIVKTEGTGIKGHYDKDSIVYLTEAYENIESKFDKGIYGKNVDIYLEKDVPEELAIDLGRVETKGKVYNTGKIYLKRK